MQKIVGNCTILSGISHKLLCEYIGTGLCMIVLDKTKTHSFMMRLCIAICLVELSCIRYWMMFYVYTFVC